MSEQEDFISDIIRKIEASYHETMKRILKAVAEQKKGNLVQQKDNNVFLMSEYAEGNFYLTYSKDNSNPSVDVEFRSYEFENKAKMEDMGAAIVKAGINTNFSAYTNPDNTILFRKTIMIQDIVDESRAISDINKGIDILIHAVVEIRDKWHKWPTKQESEDRRKVEAAKKEAEQRKAMELISAFFSRGEKEAREEAERQEREAKREAEEEANEKKGLSLLKGLFGKKKASVEGMSKARGSVDKVIDDTVTRTIGGVTIRTSMKTILQEAAQGLKKSLYQEKENVFRLSSFRTGQFHYSYYREEKGFDVAVSFKSNEFENKEIAEKMRLDIMDYLKSRGFDDCEVVETKKVLIRKDIILRDKKEGDLIARIQNTTNLLIDVVQKIDGWREWPEDQFRKRQRLMIESRRKIEELRSRVADCEADCARHKRDSYYIQKRADAKAALQKEKLRFEKLDSGVDLDEID